MVKNIFENKKGKNWKKLICVLLSASVISAGCGEKNNEDVPPASWLMVGGTMSSRTARQLTMASTAPAAPSRWPVMDFVELMLSL